MEPKKIYLSGQVTGTIDYIERFDRTEKEVKKLYPNAEVVNPVIEVITNVTNVNDYEQVMAFCLSLENDCDAVYMLKDWKKSNGAKIEYNFAIKNNKKILFEED